MNKQKNKVLITGGTGYIGAHTAVSLIEQGYDVVLIDNLSNSSEDILIGIEKITGVLPEFEKVDLANYQELNRFLSGRSDIEAVIHFAALKAVKESVEKPISYYRNNLFALVNLLELMQKYSIRNLVYSSSATVYGEQDEFPLTELHETKPALSPYGNTKKIGEEMIRDLTAVSDQINAVALRYFNPIGAHSSFKIGELPNGIPNNLLPFITQTAAGVREELLVFGNDYATNDGTAIRDYIHVVDLALAHVKTVERLIKQHQKSNFEIFNLGTGQGYSVLEVIRSFEKMSGLKLPFRIVGRRAGDVEKMYASTELANNELGWKATRSLDDMTHSAWMWEKSLRQLA